MIQYYQELLNECIDIAEAKTKYKNMLLTLLKMKYRLKSYLKQFRRFSLI